MTWFRVDDAFPSHRKVLALPRGAKRLTAVGAWTLVGAWVSGNSNDGHVPDYVLDDLAIPAKVADELVRVGLWKRVGDGFQVHDYLAYNPSKEQVDKDRAAAAERQRRGRERQKASRRDSSVTHAEVTEAVTDPVTVVPTRPDPTPKTETPSLSSRKRATAAPDIFPITEAMAAWGRENAPLVKDPAAETRQFLDHAKANGKKFTDWPAAWRTWMGNANKWAAPKGKPVRSDLPPDAAWLENM